jgi:hypothetical protein
MYIEYNNNDRIKFKQNESANIELTIIKINYKFV